MNLGTLRDTLPTPDDAAWYDVITKFKNYAAKFASNYNELKSVDIDAGKYPELSKLQLDLLRRGLTVKATIQSVMGAVDNAWTWLKGQFGFEGVRELGSLSTGLGVVPLVPIAVVVAAVALIAKWLMDYNSFKTRLTEVKRLEAKGYSSDQAANIVDKIYSDKSLFNLGQAIPVVFIGGLALFAYLNRNKG